MRLHRLNPARGAFTLVELLVVLGIMLVLMSLAVVMATSGILDNHRLSAGSDRVSGWLLQARSKAFRDRLPRGIRFVPNAQGFVTEAQFIEVPEPYVPNPSQSTGGMKLVFSYRQQVDAMGAPLTNVQPRREVYILGALTDLNNAILEAAAGDTLKIASFTSLQRITALTIVNRTIVWEGTPQMFPMILVDLANPLLLPDLGPFTLQTQTAAYNDSDTRNLQYLTMQFSFLRQARPMLGEQPLKFSANTAVQLSLVPNDTMTESLTSLSLIPAVNGSYDVLFAPTGEVLNNGGLGRVVLWMRNPDLATAYPTRVSLAGRTEYEASGEMALITVYCKTGAVATHPVGMPPVAASPYQYTKDGIASGL